MKKRRLRIIAIMLLGLSTVATGSWEIQGAYETFLPKDGLWESQAHGAEARVTHWWEPSGVGLAFAAGYTDWQVKHQTSAQGVARSHTLHGKAKYIPVGVYALARGELADHPNLITTLETGLRYFVADSRIELTETLDLGGGPPDRETYAVDSGDGLVARFGAGLELKLTEGKFPPRLFANLGYQLDLIKGEATEGEWTNFSRKIGLAGTSIQLGLAIPLR